MEARVPRMRKKGRLEPGMDADIVVFNPNTVTDKATYQDPAQFSAGFAHVLVNGVVTLRDGKFVEGAAGGVAIRAH
jgi:N-acyl-D-glutamate deacylase